MNFPHMADCAVSDPGRYQLSALRRRIVDGDGSCYFGLASNGSHSSRLGDIVRHGLLAQDVFLVFHRRYRNRGMPMVGTSGRASSSIETACPCRPSPIEAIVTLSLGGT